MRTTGFGAAKHHSWHQTAFASLHGFVLPCRDKVFPSSPQFCPILTTFLYPRVISTSSVHQCHKAQIVPVCWQHFLFPSYNPVGYEGTCLWEYILFLDSHLQCALRAPSSTVCQWNRALGSGTHCPLWDRRRIQDLYPRAGQAEVQGVCNWAESLWKRGKPSMNLLMENPAGGWTPGLFFPHSDSFSWSPETATIWIFSGNETCTIW